jgi:hypothetical protein
MDDSTLIFELFLRNGLFMDKLDNFIMYHVNNNIIELKSIPSIVLFIIELLEKNLINSGYNIKLSVDEMYKLLVLYRTYIISKKICKTNLNDFIDIYNTCTNLSIRKIKIIKRRRFLCCYTN